MKLFFGLLAIAFGLATADDRLPIAAHTMFPKGFKFASATASYQVEGAWDVGGKGQSIWDNITHEDPSFTADYRNGDVADDSYHLYKQDVQLLKTIGFQMYRFSISWPRILPNGRLDNINPDGLKYYHNLIDELLANGIEPVVTIYHWDLPQALQVIGGWLNPDIADIFADYAGLLFQTYGNKVKYWITINEPYSVIRGYGTTSFAPALNQSGVGDYISGHNILRAHAKAYRLYHSLYSHQNGKISIAHNGNTCIPKTNTPDDIAAAERCYQFTFGWFAHPVYTGDYHPLMRKIIDENSRHVFPKSRLPSFTEEEKRELNGSGDFFAVNYYSLYLAQAGATGANPSQERDQHAIISFDPTWPTTPCSWMTVVPQGLRILLNKIKGEYGNPQVLITENGLPDDGSDPLNDPERINFLETHFAELRRAIYEDGCNVFGHTTWSLLDNFEWRDGYTKKFGLVSVDFNDPERKRRMKKSALWLQNYIAMHKYY